MRLTTDFWVSAVTRRAFAAGGFAAILRKGAEAAGAVMIMRRTKLGEIALYAPAPQSSYGDARPEERLFVELSRSLDLSEIEAKIEREARFDPDIWVVELEVDEVLFAEIVPTTMP